MLKLLDEQRALLSKRRVESAEECLLAAQSNYDNDFFKAAANRAYYAIFHAMRAVLALDGFDSRKHSGIIAEFRKNYIKPGVFDSELSATITELYQSRSGSDYDDFYVISIEDLKRQILSAQEFVEAVKKYLSTIE